MIVKFALFQLALGGIAAIYWLCIRPVLMRQPAAAAALGQVDAQALSLWARIAAKLQGLKTIIAARLYMIAGPLVMLYDQVVPLINDSGLDLKPLIQPQFVPYIMFGTGALFMWLRHVTTTPVPKD